MYCDYCGFRDDENNFIHENFNLHFCREECRRFYYIETNKNYTKGVEEN
jgi:hypothetical protein